MGFESVVKPVVGVTTSMRRMQTGWWFTRRAVRDAGGVPQRLTAADGLRGFERLDALILGGGADLDPKRYDQEPLISTAYDTKRDELEWAALERAISHGLPVLGICRGAQLINVFYGGTLHQDLRSVVAGFRSRSMLLARKQISIEPGTRLHQLLGSKQIRVNSLHRQGVDRLGAGLRVAARESSGVVQALENAGADGDGSFLLGVQWHPEYLPHKAHQHHLFRSLIDAARRRAM